MLELLFIVWGLSASRKKQKLSKIDRNRYSHVDERQFSKWKEMQSIAFSKTLVAVGAYVACAIVIVLAFAEAMGVYIVIPYLINMIFWVGYQDHFHRKAKKLARELNIVWP